MKEMNSRSRLNMDTSHKMPPAPSFVKVTDNNGNNMQSRNRSSSQSNFVPPVFTDNATQETENQNLKTRNNQSASIFPGATKIPFLDKLMKDSDTALIIGLLLILMSENADKRLLFALVYILL